MSLSFYLWGIRFFTLMTLIAWLGVVFFLDPNQTGFVGLVIFFLSLFILLTGILLLFVIGVYRKGLGDMVAAHHLTGAFRQAILLALYAMGIVLFQYWDVLLWWDALLLFASILLVEFSFRRFSYT